MNKIENCPNTEYSEEENDLLDKMTTLREELETLSGDELEVWLERWQMLLLSDKNYISLMLILFSEVSRKVNGITPIKDTFSFLNFLAQLKQFFFSCDIFSYGETIYNEYMEGIYYIAGSCSYYLKPAFLQKYAEGKLEQYKQVSKTLEEHYQNHISEWLEKDRENRVGYVPSLEEITYLKERAQVLIRVDGNMDKALFFLYRAVLLSLKRSIASEQLESMQENKRLLDCLFDMVTAYQLLSDDNHALEMLEYAQNISDREFCFIAQNINIPLQKSEINKIDKTIWENKIKNKISDAYGEDRQKILRKKGHIKKELFFKENGITREEVLSCYQEALSFSEAFFGSESTQAEEIKKDIAWFRANSGEQGEIIVLLEQLKKAEQEEDFDTLESLHGLISEIYEEAGDFEQAILHFQKKVKIVIDEYGEDSDVAADDYNMFGELYEKAGRNKDARAYYKHALTNYRAYLLRTQEEDADDPENTLMNYEECLYHMGRMHLAVEEYEEAISHFQEALEIYNSRCKYSSGKRADYLKALAETYEKMSFISKAIHYYLWAWDTYYTVAEFNQLRERNIALFEEETKECKEKEEQIRLHLLELGRDQMFFPFEEIDYTALEQEEQEYFLAQFGQLIRRRLKNEDIWKKWIFQWDVYDWICKEWQQRTETDIPIIIKEAFSILQRYLKKEESEQELEEFRERFLAYLSEEYEEEEEVRENYLSFYYALGDFFHAIAKVDVDFRSFQELICNRLPVCAEVFTTAYSKEEGYTRYERQLRYQQVVSSSVFAEWIAWIQKEISIIFRDCD